MATREALAIVLMSPVPSMPKPVTGLPVLAMPSTTRCVQPVLDADHDHGGDVRVRAGADQRAEMELEVLAELQPAIGVRQGERALDVVRDRLAGGVGEVVEGQDDDVVAHADAAVLAPVAPEFQVRVSVRLRHRCSPPLRLDVVDVHVLALADVGDRLADVLAVLPDRVARLDVVERDLVADRDVARGSGGRPSCRG